MTCLRQVKAGMNMGKRCLHSRPRGPAPKISPARKGWVHRQASSAGRAAPHSPFVHYERTRISYFTSLTSVTYVVLPKENHMQLTEAATLDRKSGEAEGSAVPRTFPGNVFDRSASAVEGPTVSSPRLMKYRTTTSRG